MRRLLASNVFRVGIVALSAAIIFGAWAFAEYGGDETPSDGDSAVVLSLDDEYEQARRAAEAGDTDEAVVMLERILTEDPGHARAAALLRQLNSADAAGNESASADDPGTQPDEPGDSPGDSPDDPGEPADDPAPRDDSAYLVAVGDLDSLLPQLISGWQRGAPVATDVDATVPFTPTTSQAMSRALYTVHDRGSAEAAQAFIDRTSKVAYRENGATVNVGVVEGYFGTDGSRLATVAFTRGRFAFEVVVTVPGGDPASSKDAVVALAREFEATR
jgi:hypothetical protein